MEFLPANDSHFAIGGRNLEPGAPPNAPSKGCPSIRSTQKSKYQPSAIARPVVGT